jgi:hypothetical protein
MGRPRKDDEIIVGALALGKTYPQAARIAGVGERTVSRRMQDPAFAQRVRAARAAAAAENAAELAALMPKAIGVLGDLLYDAESGIRLRAAQVVFKVGLEYRERAELEERLRILEDGSENAP